VYTFSALVQILLAKVADAQIQSSLLVRLLCGILRSIARLTEEELPAPFSEEELLS
jgi:hypothetical protein